MGRPSDEEIRSDETLTEYVDGELADSLLLHFFKLELSKDPKLQYRLQNMVAIKSQIASIFGTNQMRATEFVKNEIQKIVKNAQIPEALPDHDDEETEVTDAELLINSMIDGELADPELSMVEKLITDNDTYRELYEQLVTSKIKISSTLLNENLEPNAKVKMDIKSLVSGQLEQPGKAKSAMKMAEPEPIMMYEEQSSFTEDEFEELLDQEWADIEERDTTGRVRANREKREQKQNIKKRLVTSLNYYAQRLVPLAAVFVVGLYISPTLFSSGPIDPNEYSGKLRGGSIPSQSNESFDLISIIPSGDAKAKYKMINGMPMPRGDFHLLLTAPSDGEMSISFETSEQNDITKVKKGENSENLGRVKAGQTVRYPTLKTKAMEVDDLDQLLRIDFEIREDNKIFRFTKFIEFGSLKKLE